jgi:hypothetical protein
VQPSLSTGRSRGEILLAATGLPLQGQDGTAMVAEGGISGRFDSSRTSVPRTRSLELTPLAAAGTVVDACDSSTIHWQVRQ